MADPMVFNIQKFSTHDGDGVRTTVFFKGCPLRCEWCHNPESQRYEKELIFHRSKCTVCGACVEKCPRKANRIENGKLIFDRSRCTACGICTDWCVNEAREIAGKEYTVDEIVREVKKDQIFYEQSGGGVTLSGGEVMAGGNMDYVAELCRKLQREGISVFIDTSGYCPWENFEKILPYTDIFLYDIKLLDPEKHKKYIGVDNRRIIDNLLRLNAAGAGIYIRLPLIQKVNADEGYIREVIDFLKKNEIHTKRISLLPYHDTGKGKYAALDRPYDEESMQVPPKEEIQHYKEMFENAGFHDVKTGG